MKTCQLSAVEREIGLGACWMEEEVWIGVRRPKGNG